MWRRQIDKNILLLLLRTAIQIAGDVYKRQDIDIVPEREVFMRKAKNDYRSFILKANSLTSDNFTFAMLRVPRLLLAEPHEHGRSLRSCGLPLRGQCGVAGAADDALGVGPLLSLIHI